MIIIINKLWMKKPRCCLNPEHWCYSRNVNSNPFCVSAEEWLERSNLSSAQSQFIENNSFTLNGDIFKAHLLIRHENYVPWFELSYTGVDRYRLNLTHVRGIIHPLVSLAALGLKICFPSLDCGGHIFWQFRLKSHCLACLGMYKSQALSM